MDIQNQTNEILASQLRRRLLKIILFIAYPAYGINSLVTAPLLTIFNSDVETEALSLVFYALNTLIDLFVMFLAYGIVIYGLYKLSTKQMRPIFFLVVFAPVFKYALKIAISPAIDGFPTLNEFLMDIYSLGRSTLFEILQFLIIALISYKYIAKYKSMESAVDRASERLGIQRNQEMSAMPFKNLLDLKNPLQRGAFVSGIVISSVRILMLIINDVSRMPRIEGFMNTMVFVGSYLLEFIVGIIGYLFTIYLFITLWQKENNKK